MFSSSACCSFSPRPLVHPHDADRLRAPHRPQLSVHAHDVADAVRRELAHDLAVVVLSHGHDLASLVAAAAGRHRRGEGATAAFGAHGARAQDVAVGGDGVHRLL